MFYRRRASPKHRYNMTEVEYGGGGHRTRLRNDHEDQLVSRGAPLPPYIKEQGGGRPALGRAKEEESPTPTRRGKESGREGRGGVLEGDE